MHHLLRNYTARLTFITTLLFFVAFYTLLVPLPRYLANLGLPDWQVGLVLGAFGIAALVGRPLAGLSSDQLSRRTVIMLGALLFFPGVLGMAQTEQPLLLLLARCLQALGYVAVTTAATALIMDVTPEAGRGAALAWFGIAANVAMTLTPAAVDALLQRRMLDLRGGFWLAAALALGCLALAWRLKEQRIVGADEQPVAREKLWSLPPAIVRPWLAAALLGVGFGAWLQYLPLLTARRGVEPTGLLYALYGIAIIGTRLVTGPWLDRAQTRPLLVAGFGLLASGLAIFAWTHSLVTYMPATLLVAAGGGILHPLLMALHVRTMPEAMRGRAVATFYLGFDLGNGLGTWLLGFVWQAWGLTTLLGIAALCAGCGMGLPAGGKPNQQIGSLVVAGQEQLHREHRGFTEKKHDTTREKMRP
ncbi:MAG: MFS transporter [Chloroflexi bacterium]|nr:MFS transporter [Chloroflexota bacterium]